MGPMGRWGRSFWPSKGSFQCISTVQEHPSNHVKSALTESKISCRLMDHPMMWHRLVEKYRNQVTDLGLLQARFAKGTKLTIIEPMLLACDWSTFADTETASATICRFTKSQSQRSAEMVCVELQSKRVRLAQHTDVCHHWAQTKDMLDEFNDDYDCKCIACLGLLLSGTTWSHTTWSHPT